MGDLFKIAHISDLHIGQTSDVMQGIDVRSNFKQALNSCSVKNSDFIFLSGDLADNGEMGAYEFINEEMNKFGKPWAWIPGNHDDLDKASAVLPMPDYVQGTTFDYILDIGGRRFICLDNSCGELQPRQFDWLKQHDNKPFSIFMHYPPCFCGHAFMDSKYPMKDVLMVQNFIENLKNLEYVFCGHYHFACHIELKNNKQVYVAPSTQMQISSTSKTFELESSKPSWQILTFEKDLLKVEIKKD